MNEAMICDPMREAMKAIQAAEEDCDWELAWRLAWQSFDAETLADMRADYLERWEQKSVSDVSELRASDDHARAAEIRRG